MQTTKTEYKIADLAARGYQAKEIATKLYNSPKTIETHLKNIKKKNNLGNMADLVREFILDLDNPKSYFRMIFGALMLAAGSYVYFNSIDFKIKNIESSFSNITVLDTIKTKNYGN